MDIADTLDHYRRNGVRAAVHTTKCGSGLITIAGRRSFPYVSPSAALAAWFDFLALVHSDQDTPYDREEETHGNATAH